jgi:hypothetical protein
MMKILRCALTLCLILALVAAVVSIRTQASGENSMRPIRLYASASSGPIGRIQPFGVAIINGQFVQDDRLIWSGDMLQAPADRSVRVLLDSIGQVMLAADAVAKLSVARTMGDNDKSCEALVASLIRGDMSVDLQEEAAAYVEACGQAFTATSGAKFRLGIREGRAVLDREKGDVAVQAQQRQYIIRPVGLGATISVRARSTRQIQVQVTDENDKPVPDVPVIFLLSGRVGVLGSGPTAGTSITVTTNSQGLATTSFTAGPSSGSATISARVPGTNAVWTAMITTVVAAGIPTAAKIALVAGISGVAAGLLIANRGESNLMKPIRPVGKPTIRP